MTDGPPKKHPPVGRQAFAAIQDDIKAALDRGEWMTSIYEARKATLPFSYAQFTRHVRRVFGDPKGDASTPATNPAAVPPPPPPPPPRLAAPQPRPSEPLQQVKEDRPKRFKMKSKTDSELF